MAGNEPGAAILALFDQIVNEIKQARPVRSDNKPLGGGLVYSMMVLGMPVDPIDYSNPWSPMGGSTVAGDAGAQSGGGTAPAAGGTSAGGAAPAGKGGAAGAAAPGSLAADPKFATSMRAAFKTSKLADVMLQVTTDGTYLEYPVGRHISFQYEGIIHGMQPGALPPVDPAVQQQIDAANKVLYEFANDGTPLGPTPLYKAYRKNAQAYAMAKAQYAEFQAKTLADPATADQFPMLSAPYQEAVDSAYNDLQAGGAPKIELALDVVGAQGISMQDHMISEARQTYDVWGLGLAGVPESIPYSYFDPTSWCDPNDDQIGWQQLTVDSSSYQSYDASQWKYNNQGSWRQDASSTSVGVDVGFAFWSVNASVATSDASSQWQGSTQYAFQSGFHNSAKNLSISLEYGLVTMYRPWLVSDLFYMDNWYLVGNKKNSVSDGTQADQAGKKDPLLPMLPQQFLVIRNVSISAEDWGEDQQILTDNYSGYQGSTSSTSTSVSAGGGISLGFVNFGGSASHSSSHAEGQGSNWAGADSSSHFGTTFDGSTLSIKGAQIIAFLSDIMPASPPLDDPQLAAPASATTTSTSTTTTQPGTN
jgi:hypothetical protein